MKALGTTASKRLRARPWTVSCALAAFLLLHSAAWAGGFKSLAKELSRAAQDSGIARVAVLAFEPADSSSPKDGRPIAEKLTTQLVRAGGVQTVERALIGKLLGEQRLGKTGLIDRRMLKKLGAIFSVDGIVTGSFVTSGSRIVVNARLIDVESGLIIAACERDAPREWTDGPAPALVPAPESMEDPLWDDPRIFTDKDGVFRDSLAEEDCALAAGRADRMESAVLDLKARYWALRLRGGSSLSGAWPFPGANISDLELRQTLYDRMRDWYAQSRIPALSPGELRRLSTLDRRVLLLHVGCLDGRGA
ncbi:MAG: FlgO family outer membrane protein [Elusimicrobiota bacterium]